MASIYKNVKNAKDLLIMVRSNGLSTKEEDICRVQDIFGHSTEEELVELANDNGRMDEKGNSDPQGSWANGSNGLSSTFYFVLFKIWCWEEATRFYNEHSNFPLISKMKELTCIKRELTEMVHKEMIATKMHQQEKERADAAEVAMLKAESELKKANDEIIRLKAKLYDLIEEKGQ